MDITKFLYLLLAFSIAIIFYDIDQVDNLNDDQEKPLVSFYDTVVYNMDTKSVNHVIPSKEIYLYRTREEMVDSTIVTRGVDNQTGKNTNSLSAQNIIKVDNDVYLDGNVNVQMANGLNLRTEQLHFNLDTKIARNEQRFVVTRDFHDFYGKNFYYDTQKEYLQAEYPHFKIKVENE